MLLSWRLVGLVLATLLFARVVVAEEDSDIITWEEYIDRAPSCSLDCVELVRHGWPCDDNDMTCFCDSGESRYWLTACFRGVCDAEDVLRCGFSERDISSNLRWRSMFLLALSIVCLMMRFGYKIGYSIDLGIDDWLTLATLCILIATSAIGEEGLMKSGVGRDVWTNSVDQVYDFGRWFYIFTNLYYVEVALTKLAVLFFYLHIFPGRDMRRLLWGTVAFAATFGLAYVFVSSFQCKPISYFWTYWDGEHEGSCLNVDDIPISNAAISIILDVWMLALPLWQLRSLKLDWKKKVGVGLMFSMGLFVTLVSILRLQILVQFDGNHLNPTWDYYYVCLWSIVEINTAIVCACMPAMRQLLVKWFPSLASASTLARKYGSSKAGSRHNNSKNAGSKHTTSSRKGNDNAGSSPESSRDAVNNANQPRASSNRLSEWAKEKTNAWSSPTKSNQTQPQYPAPVARTAPTHYSSAQISAESIEMPIMRMDSNPHSVGGTRNPLRENPV